MALFMVLFMIGFQTGVSSSTVTVVNDSQKRALLEFYTAKQHGNLRTGFEKLLSPHETTDAYKASGIESLFFIGKGDYLKTNPVQNPF